MITTETLNKLAEMQQAKTEALAKMPQDAYDRIKTALLNKLNSIDNSFEGLLKNLLLIAANWKQLGMPAINGLVAYAVAGEMLTETTEPSQKATTTEVKEPEAKILHAIIFGQKRVKKDYNYKNVVYAVNLEAIEYHQPLAMKHHRAALLLNHMMGTGRLSGTRVYFKIHNMTTIAVTKLITEITNFLTKFDGKPMDEMELIGWLKKKARKDPFAV